MAAIEVKTKGFDRAIADQDKLNKTAEKQQRIVRATADEVKRSGAMQQRIIRETETAQERYNRQMRSAQVALAGHAREVDLLARYEKRLQTELRESSRLTKEVAVESDDAFDVGRVTKWVAAFSSSILSINAVASAVAEVRQNARDAADELQQNSRALGEMLQLAGDDAAMGKKLIGMSNTTFREGYVQNQDQAHRLVTELKSTDQLGDRGFYSKLAVIDDPVAAAKSVGLIKEVYRGGDPVGNAQAIYSKQLAAAGPAIGVSGSEMAAAVAEASVPAQAFKLTDEEVTAMVSRVAQVTGKGPESGQVVRAFLTTLIREGMADRMKGQGVEPIIDAINQMGLDDSSMVDFFGNDYAYKAFSQLKDKDALKKRIEMIKRAENTGFATKTAEMAMSFEQVAGPVRERAGKAAVSTSRTQKGTRTLTAQGIQDQRIGTMEREGYSDFSIWLTNLALGMGRGLGMVPGLGDEGLIQADKAADDYAARQLRVLESIDKKTGPASIPVR